MTVPDITELSGSGTAASTDSESNSDDAGASIPDVLLGHQASRDRIEKFKRQNDEGNFEKLEEFARDLTDEIRAAAEQYRALNDIKRIRDNFLFNYMDEEDVSFDTWLDAFWYGVNGTKDDPTDDSYNGVQSHARDLGANLFFYRVLYPEPDMEYWPDDEVYRWYEFDANGWGNDEQDTDIFVTGEFAEQCEGYTMEVGGETRRRPPTDSELGGGASSPDTNSVGAPLDPAEFTVEELRDELGAHPEEEFSPQELGAVLEAEKEDKDRKTARKAIKGALNQTRDAYDSPASNRAETKQAELDEASPARIAGQLLAEHDLDASPDLIAGMVEKGMAKGDIVEILG